MPLYEYICPHCEHTFEELVFGSDAAVECPKCQAKSVERLLSVPARPQSESQDLPMSCGEGPPCGAPGCRRMMQ
jgi:putative FmdB family regulatory protein